jgi:hypothetical protein
MAALTTGSFQRPADMWDMEDPRVLYVRSYLLIRKLVGIIGIALPLVLIAGEAFFLRGPVEVRGSLSAYYHTDMRDVFVGALSVIGFLLLTYMAGQRNTFDFWLSCVAGAAVLGVTFLPTQRPGLSEDDPRCGVTPEPTGCSPVQQAWGETLVSVLHFVAAFVFIVALAAICFLFAHRARVFDRNLAVARFTAGCGWAIVAALAWIGPGMVVDLQIGPLTALYVGEVVSVWAFGAAWLVKGRVGARSARPVAPADRGGG